MTAPLFKWGNLKKVFSSTDDIDPASVLIPAMKIVALPVNGTAFDPPRAIIADLAGTGTVTDASGNSVAGFPFTGHEQNLALTAITALATTTKVWGLY